MELEIYQVDAFSDRVFGGNPAAVVPLTGAWISDDILQSIAAENNLSETAFVRPRSDGHFDLRWFTPRAEVRLCGHATLATAHILFEHQAMLGQSLIFHTKSGQLMARRIDQRYLIDLPSDHPVTISLDTAVDIIGADVAAVYAGRDDLVIEVQDYSVLESMAPDMRAIEALPYRGLVVTSPGDTTDIACRCFYPALGINEDPVTGSAHTVLAPLWSARLLTNVLSSHQCGRRQGYVDLVYKGDYTSLIGSAVTYMSGKIFVQG